MFFMLCFRLPAYRGVMQAVARQEAEGTGGARRPSRGRAGGYERNSPQANNARTADFAPPATGGSIAALDTHAGWRVDLAPGG